MKKTINSLKALGLLALVLAFSLIGFSSKALAAEDSSMGVRNVGDNSRVVSSVDGLRSVGDRGLFTANDLLNVGDNSGLLTSGGLSNLVDNGSFINSGFLGSRGIFGNPFLTNSINPFIGDGDRDGDDVLLNGIVGSGME